MVTFSIDTIKNQINQFSIPPVTKTCGRWTLKIAGPVVSFYLFDKYARWVENRIVPLNSDRLYDEIVFIPFIEEFIFRGLIQSTIKLCQKGIYQLSGKTLSDVDVKTQQIIRVHLSAMIFAVTHLINHDYQTPMIATVQVFNAYLIGIGFGYLRERCQSLYPTTYIHVLNNGLCYAWANHIPGGYSIKECVLELGMAGLTYGLTKGINPLKGIYRIIDKIKQVKASCGPKLSII